MPESILLGVLFLGAIVAAAVVISLRRRPYASATIPAGQPPLASRASRVLGLKQSIRSALPWFVLWATGSVIAFVVWSARLVITTRVNSPSWNGDVDSWLRSKDCSGFPFYTNGCDWLTPAVLTLFHSGTGTGSSFSRWWVLWTLAIAVFWLYRRIRSIGSTVTRSRLTYLFGWAFGLVALLNWMSWLVDALVPSVALDLFQYTSVLPLAAIWTVLVVVLFIYLGDGDDQGLHAQFFKRYKEVWLSLALAMLVTFLASNFAYIGVMDRVRGLMAAQTLGQGLSGDLRDTSDRIQNGSSNLDRVFTDYTLLTSASSKRSFLKYMDAQVLLLEQQAEFALYQANAALDAVEFLASDTAIDLTGGDAGATDGSTVGTGDADDLSMSQIVEVLRQSVTSAERVVTDVALLRAEFNEFSELELSFLNMTIVPGLKLEPDPPVYNFGPAARLVATSAEGTENRASLAVRALGSLEVGGLSIFLGIAGLYAVLVLFPWVLVLLFLFRKRESRAAQILEDLRLIDSSMPARVTAQTKTALDQAIDSVLARTETSTSEPAAAGNGVSPPGVIPSLVTEADINHRAIIERAFSNIEYVMSLLVLTVLTSVGWHYVLFPRAGVGVAELIRDEGGIVELTKLLASNTSALSLGFVGAYFFVAQMLLRRYLSGDLYPAAFLQGIVRVVLALILALVLGILLPSIEIDSIEAASLLAFTAGFWPQFIFPWITTKIGALVSLKLPDAVESNPLTKLDGLSIWHEVRLLEEKLENVQAMATADIAALVMGTQFSAATIIDWVDQAILYIHCGDRGQWFPQLRDISIRTASDLLKAAGMDVTNPDLMAAAAAGPDDTRLQEIAGAVTSVRTDEERTKCLDVSKEVLREMFGAIWPDPNIRYVLQYHANVANAESAAAAMNRAAAQTVSAAVIASSQ